MWWPLAVPASRWFSEEERASSRRYHEPLQRAAVAKAVARCVGLLAAWWLAVRTGASSSAVIGAAVAALTLPRVTIDAWHEFIHEPRFDVEPVSSSAFALTSLGRIGVEGVALVLLFALLESSRDAALITGGAAAVAATLVFVTALAGHRIVLTLHRAIDVEDEHHARRHVFDIVSMLQLSAPRLVRLDPASFGGANAYVTGSRSGVTVAVSQQLLDGPDELLRHVVAHEASHLQRRHLWWSGALSSIAVAVTVGVSLQMTLTLVEGSARLPVALLALGLVSLPFRLLLAWVSRAHERQADAAAMHLAPITPELVSQLHLSDRPLLEPSRTARWVSSHPSPAERVELAARAGKRTTIV